MAISVASGGGNFSSERLRPAGWPAYGSAFAFAGCLPSRSATAQ